jgi:hypothetical protein
MLQVNPYIVGYTFLLTDEGLPRFDDLRSEFGERRYETFNPNLTEEVCKALSRRNCKHCYNSGLLHLNNAKSVRWEQACYCVQNKIAKMDEQMQQSILGGYNG